MSSQESTKVVKKNWLAKAFHIPSTAAGRIRLAGLLAYTVVSIACPGVPQAVKLGITTVMQLVNGISK